MADGLYFLHEYPNGSSSVHELCLESLLKEPGGYRVEGPMCFWGMTAKDEQGEGLVKKEAWWVTNSECIARELARECSNVRSQQVGERSPAAWHRHVRLVKRASKARVYPPKLVAGILRGAGAQVRRRLLPGSPRSTMA